MLEVRQSIDGGWLVVAARDRALLVDLGASADAGEATALLQGLTAPDGFERTIEALTAHGLANTPAFALVDRDAGSTARCVLRGPVLLRVTTGEGMRELRAERVSTWLEKTIADVHAFRISAAEVEAGTSAPLPLVHGAVWAVEASTAGAAEVTLPDAADVAAPDDVAEPDEAAELDDATIVVPPQERSRPVTEATITETTLTGAEPISDATVMRGAEPADRAPADPEPADAAAEGDHDGRTILSSRLRTIRPDSGTPDGGTPAKPAPRYFVELSDGRREDLRVPIVVGRAPGAESTSHSRPARPVVVDSAEQDISRSHVLLAVEGDTVVVTDLHSRNGTVVVNPGARPQKLRRGEPTAVILGSLIDLGGGVVMTVGSES